MEAKFIKTFGPSIVKAKIPEKIVNDINEYVDKIIADKEKSKNLNDPGMFALSKLSNVLLAQ